MMHCISRFDQMRSSRRKPEHLVVAPRPVGYVGAALAVRTDVPANELRLFGGIELLVHESGRDRRLGLAPKPLGLLAYLAVACSEGRAVRRDVLLALFWPELSAAHARGSLRQALFQLRRTLGPHALHTDRESVAMAPEALSCDVIAFAELLARGDREAAVELYRGDLLEGFFIDGMSEELEEWMDAQRTRLKHEAVAACWRLADEAQQSRNAIAAGRWARRGAALAPDDEIAIRRLIQILDAFGDRAGALRAAEDFALRVTEQFGTGPSPETRALVAAVRERTIAPAVGAPSVSAAISTPMPPAAALTEAGAPNAASAPRTRAGFRRGAAPWPQRLALGAGLLVIVVSGALVATRRGHRATPARTESPSDGSPPITIASAVARRLYAEGLDRYYAGDNRESARLLGAALAEDSACAMCAYYAAMANDFDDSTSARMNRLALRLADRVSQPERLLIRYQWADAANDPGRRAIADSLATQYPGWLEAQLAEAEALRAEGEWIAAASHFRRAIDAQPATHSESSSQCPACAARSLLVTTYEAADSALAALRVAQGLVRAQPRSRSAWLTLSFALAEAGRYDEARAATDTATRYASGTDDDAIAHAQIEIRAGNFTAADGLLRTVIQTGTPNSKHDAFWWLLISLRTQGRMREALALSQGPMRRVEASSTNGADLALLGEAQVLFELGQYRRAAAIFIAHATPENARFWQTAPGRVARQRAWLLTQAGSALAAAGDTIALTQLADTVEIWGRKSGFTRDHRLHEYLHGLLWTARGRPDMAVAAFRRAMFSESRGFSRLNLQLARALIGLGRGREAVPLLQHSLAGPPEAGGFYATRTELEELLARVRCDRRGGQRGGLLRPRRARMARCGPAVPAACRSRSHPRGDRRTARRRATLSISPAFEPCVRTVITVP